MDNLLEGFLQLAKGNDKNLSMEELLTDYMNKNTNTVLSTLHNLLKA